MRLLTLVLLLAASLPAQTITGYPTNPVSVGTQITITVTGGTPGDICNLSWSNGIGGSDNAAKNYDSGGTAYFIVTVPAWAAMTFSIKAGWLDDVQVEVLP